MAIVLAPGERGELDLLFIRRAEEPADPWSGQMALPGGRREDDDPDLMTTAMRETFEETAVELPRQSLLGELDDLAPTTPVLPPIMVRPFVFGLGDKPEVVPSPEVALHLWTPLDGLPGSLGESEVSVRGVDLTRPYPQPLLRVDRVGLAPGSSPPPRSCPGDGPQRKFRQA